MKLSDFKIFEKFRNEELPDYLKQEMKNVIGDIFTKHKSILVQLDANEVKQLAHDFNRIVSDELMTDVIINELVFQKQTYGVLTK